VGLQDQPSAHLEGPYQQRAVRQSLDNQLVDNHMAARMANDKAADSDVERDLSDQLQKHELLPLQVRCWGLLKLKPKPKLRLRGRQAGASRLA